MAGKVKKSATKPQILLVEDDAFLIGIYATKLELEGFEVLQAKDGEAGLGAAQKESPDVILLDILMPKLDGFQVLEALKKDAKTKKIPVVLLSNLGQKDDVERGKALGATDYLIKAHFVPSETVQKIKHILKIA